MSSLYKASVRRYFYTPFIGALERVESFPTVKIYQIYFSHIQQACCSITEGRQTNSKWLVFGKSYVDCFLTPHFLPNTHKSFVSVFFQKLTCLGGSSVLYFHFSYHLETGTKLVLFQSSRILGIFCSFSNNIPNGINHFSDLSKLSICHKSI